MRIFIILLLAAAFTGCHPSGQRVQNEWIPLFNGKDLTGWTPKFCGYPLNENYKNTFRVEEGVLKVCYDQYDSLRGEFGHLFYKDSYSYYKLRVEYRIRGQQVAGAPGWAYKNSGMMLHCQSPESMLLGQDFPVSVEAQFLGGSGEGVRPTANVCTPGTHIVMNGELVTRHCTESTSPTFHGEEWIMVELVVLGDSIIHHLVNGDTVLSYTRPQIGGELPAGFPLAEGTPLRKGFIALQAESHPFEFRKVELLNLEERKGR